jgi:hypothetical protein
MSRHLLPLVPTWEQEAVPWKFNLVGCVVLFHWKRGLHVRVSTWNDPTMTLRLQLHCTGQGIYPQLCGKQRRCPCGLSSSVRWLTEEGLTYFVYVLHVGDGFGWRSGNSALKVRMDAEFE